MRMIDADALQELCDKRIQEMWNSKTAPVSWAHAYADFKDDVDSMPTLTQPNELGNPCDLCVYNPPSSFDGKPCTYCPAAGRPPEGEE